MADVAFSFRIDCALKDAFAHMAAEQDLSIAQALRKVMLETVSEYQEAAAHERWMQREIEDAIEETSRLHRASMSNDVVEEEWRRERDEILRDSDI